MVFLVSWGALGVKRGGCSWHHGVLLEVKVNGVLRIRRCFLNNKKGGCH